MVALLSSVAAALLAAATVVSAAPHIDPRHRLHERAAIDSKTREVFAHFIVGIVPAYTQDDWVIDMELAQHYGIDGFALNVGADAWNHDQLDKAYAAAQRVGNFSNFLSFDFNWYNETSTKEIAELVKKYADHPNQLRVDDKPFVSTFVGDGFNWSHVEELVGHQIYAVPCWRETKENAANPNVEGLMSWAAWPGQANNNTPVNEPLSGDLDIQYMQDLQSKPYMAPVSPWFSTHFGKDVAWSKNWLFKSEDLWTYRWYQMLQLGPRYIEILTWNDYGESHYVGPYNQPHKDDGSSIWASGLVHTPMLDAAEPFIKAYKRSLPDPVVEEDKLVYWFRPHLKTASCDATDNCGAKPTGAEFVEDVVFVTSISKNGAKIVVQSGKDTPFQYEVPKGVHTFKHKMAPGVQQFLIETDGGKAAGASNLTVSDQCWNGIYNYNFHSGIVTIPKK